MRTILSIILTLTLSVSYANHFSGGSIRYERTNDPKKFDVYLTLYKACETGAIDLPTFATIAARSNSSNVNDTYNLPRISNDTINTYCPGTTHSCDNISALYPGYIIGVYKGTVTLSNTSASDWKVVFTNSSRNFGITNLAGASGQSFYIESPINMIGNNSAIVEDVPPHVMFVNDTLKIPLSATDADGDNVTYQLVQAESGSGVKVPYRTGYTLGKPLGANGACYIDANNNLVMLSNQSGKFSVVIKANEYRKGIGLVSYTLRDIVVICLNSTSTNSFSMPYPTGVMPKDTLYTCPGKKNTLNLDFKDPNSADSVFVSINSNTLVGWSANLNSVKGKGDISKTLAWTTPLSLSPTSLPHFNIKVNVRDNNCQLSANATYIFRVNTRECTADSVWPGDANSDKVVNLYDPLYIAVNYGDTGKKRQPQNISWQGQVAYPWAKNFLNNIDQKHADCNGNGIIDTGDITPIYLNYSKTHMKGKPQNKTTGTADLYFDHTGISPNPDSTVTIKILLGTSANPMTSLYGMATRVSIDGITLSDSATIAYPNTWLGNTNNTLQFVKSINNNVLDWAYARINHQNKSGNGDIATITFKIPSNAPDGQKVRLAFDQTRFINHLGLDILDFNTLADSFYISKPVAIVNINKEPFIDVNILPNPADDDINVLFNSTQEGTTSIDIRSITGRLIKTTTWTNKHGDNKIIVPIKELSRGIYTLTILHNESHYRKTFKWIKK